MKIMHMATVAALLVTALAGTVLYFAWSEARADRAKLEAALSAQQQIISQAQQRENTSGQVLATTLSEIASVKKAAQTPQEILRELPRYLPLPDPLEPIPANSPVIANSAASAEQGSASGNSPRRAAGASSAVSGDGAATGGASSNAETGVETLPSTGSPSANGVLLPSADLKPLFDYVQDCRVCNAQLTSAQQDLTDERAKEQALQRESAAAVKAAKGGSMWTRLKRGAKWFGIGALAGAAAAAAAHH